MTVNGLYKRLCEIIPQSLSCEWDRDGLEVCPNPQREVKRILVALDVTDEVIKRAVDENADVIVCHHPIFFGNLSKIDANFPDGKRAVALVKADIAVMSFHTRLDAVSGGVNDTLATLLGLCNIEKAGDDGIMRVGELVEPCTPAEFCRGIKKSLSVNDPRGEATIALAEGRGEVKRVAVLGGAGGDFVTLAVESGADTYLTGELKHHQYLEAQSLGINLISAGHFFTEHPVCRILADRLHEICPQASIDICFSNKTVAF